MYWFLLVELRINVTSKADITSNVTSERIEDLGMNMIIPA